MQVYRARNPKKSPLWQCASRHYDEFEGTYHEVYQPRYGLLRPIIPEVVHKFLDCGNLERGFARIRCDHCQHEYLLAFSCKSRWFCPSCHQKNVQTTARFILDHVLAPVPHRHYVLAIPRMLRPYFQRHRRLLKRLCALAHESLREYLRTALDCPEGVPGIIMTLHTFGEYLDFHPHVHALVADGLFVRHRATAPTAAGREQAQTLNSELSTLNFLPLPETPLKPLEELFRAKVIKLLVEEKLLPAERVQVLYSWKHSGFNLHAGEQVPPEAKADLEDLAQYILRNPFSVEKMTLESPGRHRHLPLPAQCQDQPQLRGLHPHRLPGRHHPAHPRQRGADGPLLRLVLQQDARRAPARPATRTGRPPPGRFPAPAAEAPLQAVARPHPPRLARGPAPLPRLPEPDAGHRRH